MKKKLISIIIALMMVFTVIPSTCSLAYAATGDAYTINVSGTYNYDSGHEMLEYINEERASKGLEPLELDKELTDSAMQRAAEIAFYFSHTRPNGEKCYTASNKAYGENIAAGYISVQDVYEGWKNSPGHYANMTRDYFTTIGIGHFVQNGTDYWVQMFGIDDVVYETRTGTEDIKTQVDIVEQNESFSLNKYILEEGEIVSLNIGDTYNLSAGISIDNGWYGDIDADSFNWSSSDESVATVSQNGVVTACGAGSAIITATVNNGSYTKCSVSVRVGHDISNATVSGIASKEYTGNEIVQSITVKHDNKILVEGRDYKLEYENNIDPGTAYIKIIGLGGYTGTLIKQFTITGKNISKLATIEVLKWNYSKYQDEFDFLKEMVTVIYDGETLTYGEDYWFTSWNSNPSLNTINKISIEFCGHYSGTKTVTRLPKYTVTFNGNGGTASYKTKTVSYDSEYGTLPAAKRTGYTFAGWYTAKTGGQKIKAYSVHEKKSNITLYAHWKKVTVNKPSVKALLNQKGKKLKVTVGKVTGAKGYQIVIAKNTAFTKGKKTANVTTANYKVFTKLSKAKYYVKIRAYKYDSAGKKVYSKYSKVKSITIKK